MQLFFSIASIAGFLSSGMCLAIALLAANAGVSTVPVLAIMVALLAISVWLLEKSGGVSRKKV